MMMFYLPLLVLSYMTAALAQGPLCTFFQPEAYVPPPWDYPQPFLPYFAPEGTQTVDDTDKTIKYSGVWIAEPNPNAIGQTLHRTNDPKAKVVFTFTGTAIEWIGTKGLDHGTARVVLIRLPRTNPPTMDDVDGSSPTPYNQQRLWSKINFPLGRYKLVIHNIGGAGGGDSTTESGEQDVLLLANQSACLSTERPAGFVGNRLDVDAFVVTTIPIYVAPGGREENSGGWTLTKEGITGVSAMQLTMVSPTHAIIFDRTEHNFASINGHPAWAVLYNLNTHAVRPLDLLTNSFCASGSFLSNGSLLSVGGNLNAVQNSSGGFHDVDGRTALRIFEPCLGNSTDCHVLDQAFATRVTRWYPSVLRIEDGSALIVGGSHEFTFDNHADINEPTVSFFPRRHSSPDRFVVPFFERTLNANLFPHVFSLPRRRAFFIANTESTILDWGALPAIREQSHPLLNGVRVTYPMGGTALLLPLSEANGYKSRILLCGGSDASDTLCDYQYSVTHPASQQCSRIEINHDGTTTGWELDDPMPDGGRITHDGVLLPTGEVVIMGGARTGYMGIGSVTNPVGTSNADNPALSPILYSPENPRGERWRQLGVRSDIPRLYHSVASLTPNGDIMIAGSNPNQDRTVTQYPTEYRVEWLKPPYMHGDRPTYTGLRQNIDFGAEFTLDVQVPPALDRGNTKVSLMDLGYSTHSTHSNNRLVFLEFEWIEGESENHQLKITAPPNGGVYPPGPGYIFVVVGDVASKAQYTLVGDGRPPPKH